MPDVSSKSAVTGDPTVCIIIVAYDSGATLQDCVDGLLAQTFSDFRVRIVDNGPQGDRAVDALERLDSRFEILCPGRNTGFCGGNNLGAAGVGSQWLALLNPDAIPEPGWLGALVEAARTTGASMVGSMQLWRGRDGLLDGAGDAYHFSGIAWRGLRGKPVGRAPDSGETFAPCAAAALYDRRLFERVGGFDEQFFAYHEDVDLAFRMRLAGGRALQVQEARVSHVASGRPGEASALAVRLGTRNRIWTFVKDMPGWVMWALVPVHTLAVLVSLARDARRGRGGAAWSGICEAFGGMGAVLAERRRVQALRTARIVDILWAMTVSPMPLLQTGSDVRPWRRMKARTDP